MGSSSLHGYSWCNSLGSGRRRIVETIDVRVIVVWQFRAARELAHHLNEPPAHERRTQRNSRVHHPARPFEVGRDRSLRHTAGIETEGGVQGMVHTAVPNEYGT